MTTTESRDSLVAHNSDFTYCVTENAWYFRETHPEMAKHETEYRIHVMPGTKFPPADVGARSGSNLTELTRNILNSLPAKTL